jgi:integrase
MGRLFKRGEMFWIAYNHRGREYRESAGSTKEADAGRLLKKRLGEIQGNRFVGPSQERVTFSELLDGLILDYQNNRRKSLSTLEAHLKAVRAAFGLDRAVDVTEARLERYKADRLADGKAPATVNRELAAIKRAFHLAVKQKRITAAPTVGMLAEHNARQGFLERGEFEAVVQRLPESLQDFARFGYLCGWRKREIASLTWADVEREGRVIRLRPEASKNGEPRMVALEGDLWDLIEQRWTARGFTKPDGGTALSPLVFHRDGEPPGDFRKAWATACEKAGVAGRLFHDLRRSAVRNMIRAGVSQPVAMKISGHRTAAIFRRYDITTEADIREAMRKTQAHVKAMPVVPVVIPLSSAAGGRGR